MGVELHAAHHEEHRDEEAEADRLEPGLHGLGLVTVEGDADDEAGGEGTQQDLEAQRRGDEHQAGDEQEHDPHRQLGGGAELALHRLHHPGRLGPRGQEGHTHGQEHEEDEEDRARSRGWPRRAGPSPPARARTPRPCPTATRNLPNGDSTMSRSRSIGQEGAHGRGRQRQSDQQAGDRRSRTAAGRCRRASPSTSDTSQPTIPRLSGSTGQLGEVDLVAGHEEEEADPEAWTGR